MFLKKKVLSMILAIAMTAVLLAGCGGAGNAGGSGDSGDSGGAGGADGSGSSADVNDVQTESAIQSPGDDSDIMHIRVIAKSVNSAFYQEAFAGAADAAEDVGVQVTFNGPDIESDIAGQVEMVREAVEAKPGAIILAACDTDSLKETLTSAKDAGIPVIGFDSGVPGDSTGAVLATAATDNAKAGANAAKNMIEDEDFRAEISLGTEENPYVLAVLAQDVTSGSIVTRVDGFVQEAIKDLEAIKDFAGAVEVSGHERWAQASGKPAKVKIVVTAPPTSAENDILDAAKTIFETENLAGIFASNEAAVKGVLEASDGGKDLEKTGGKYKDVYVVGFDSGAAQREAVASGLFMGSVTQEAYQMGYQSVILAVKAAQNQSVADVDTGSKWYNAENIDDRDIAIYLYD